MVRQPHHPEPADERRPNLIVVPSGLLGITAGVVAREYKYDCFVSFYFVSDRLYTIIHPKGIDGASGEHKFSAPRFAACEVSSSPLVVIYKHLLRCCFGCIIFVHALGPTLPLPFGSGPLA